KLGEVVMVAEEVRSDAFALPLNFISDPMPAPARAFRLETAEGPKMLATVTLPPEGKAFIILLVPGRESVFEPVVIPAGDGTFRPGDFYVHNVSGKSVLGMVGTSKFMLPSRKGMVVRPDGAREG